MREVLVVGEHPFSTTGNAKMHRYVLSTIDTEKYRVHVFAVSLGRIDLVKAIDRPFPLPMTEFSSDRDPWGKQRLLELLFRKRFDVVVFVGFDIWRYVDIFPKLDELRAARGLKTVFLFPYDLPKLRDDWVDWINSVDVPAVYSRFGFDMLKRHVPGLQYFRPDLPEGEKQHFVPFGPEERERYRRSFFPMLASNAFVFGFFGVNQFRKDPQRLLKAFSMLLNDDCCRGLDVRLYMHTNLDTGFMNLTQYAIDCGLANKGVLITKTGDLYANDQIAALMNSVDCLVNCSLHEGLSWTVIEAMYCGIPVIASDSTAHKELLAGTENIAVPQKVPTYINVDTGSGESFVDAMACSETDIYLAMRKVLRRNSLRKKMGESGRKHIEEWSRSAGNVNDLIEQTLSGKPKKKKADAVLFMQHSSAGDVLMTTKALKGLRKRHPGIPLYYMTQKKYQDILRGNPDIDGIFDWHEGRDQEFAFVYNPHRDRILPGHWGRNSNSLLSDFYWKLLDVENGGFFIEKLRPEPTEDLPEWVLQEIEGKPVCIVHTTGGVPEFRTYKYMKDVVAGICDRYVTVQLGGSNDFDAGAHFDLRGELSFRESAWVMSQADLAVTVDSFMSHLAGAMGVSQVCLFGSGNANVVRPEQVKGNLICLQPDYIRQCPGLGPCSGAVKNCPVKCTGLHDPEDILSAIHLLEEWKKEGADGYVTVNN